MSVVIYQQESYKVVKIQVSKASTSAEIKEECPTDPQEPVGFSKSLEKETKPQISRPVLVSSATQTMPQLQISSPELVSSTTQTMSQPSTSNAGTQTLPWNQLELMNKWKKQYAEEQDTILQQHKLAWQNHMYANLDSWEQTLQQLRDSKKEVKESKEKRVLMFSLVQKLMATRKPSVNYSLFLSERLVYFQLKAIKDGRPHELLTAEKFVKTFAEAPESDQHLLCELYLHNEAIPENRSQSHSNCR